MDVILNTQLTRTLEVVADTAAGLETAFNDAVALAFTDDWNLNWSTEPGNQTLGDVELSYDERGYVATAVLYRQTAVTVTIPGTD